MINYIGGIIFRAVLDDDRGIIDNLIGNEASSATSQEYRVSSVIRMVYQAWQLGTFVTSIRAQGYEIQDVPWDGNCFFEAVARQLGDATHAGLRQDAVEYMQRHLDDFQAFLEPNYMDEMLQPGTPADEPIIRALARAIGVNIRIHYPNGRIVEMLLDDSAEVIDVGYTGGHYVALTSHQELFEHQVLGEIGLLGGGHS